MVVRLILPFLIDIDSQQMDCPLDLTNREAVTPLTPATENLIPVIDRLMENHLHAPERPVFRRQPLDLGSPTASLMLAHTKHAGSRKWSPVQIGFVPPFILVEPDYSIYGLRVGFFLGENLDVFGLDLGFVHWVKGRMYGLQLAFVNLANDVKGMQLGFVNHGEKVYGFQFGFINRTQVLYGVQFGFVNFSQNRDGQKKFMPVINIRF